MYELLCLVRIQRLLMHSIWNCIPNFALMCRMPSLFVSLFLFNFFLISLQHLLPLNCWIHDWYIAYVTSDNIYKLVCCIFCFQIFFIIYYLCFICRFSLYAASSSFILLHIIYSCITLLHLPDSHSVFCRRIWEYIKCRSCDSLDTPFIS